MSIFAAEERVIASALPYFQSVAVPSVFLALMLVLSSALRGAGDTKTPLKVTLVINVLNVILDYLLIFGFFGFPGLGILGAGLATSISRFIGVVILLCLLILRKGPLDTVFNNLALRLTLPITLQVVLKAYPICQDMALPSQLRL